MSAHHILYTFLENIDCSENPIVAIKALIKPSMSKEISVRVAMTTPPIIGARER